MYVCKCSPRAPHQVIGGTQFRCNNLWVTGILIPAGLSRVSFCLCCRKRCAYVHIVTSFFFVFCFWVCFPVACPYSRANTVEELIEQGRGFKHHLTSPSKIVHFLKPHIRTFDLHRNAVTKTGKDRVFILLPEQVGMTGNTKVDITALQDAEKAKHMYCEGGGPGSLVDLIQQKCEPPTTFPNSAVGVWQRSSGADGDNRVRRPRVVLE